MSAPPCGRRELGEFVNTQLGTCGQVPTKRTAFRFATLHASLASNGCERGSMKRREVVKGLVTAPAVWSMSAWAQPTERVRRVGVLVSARSGDAEYLALLGAFRQRMEELGWSEGRNLRIDLRW